MSELFYNVFFKKGENLNLFFFLNQTQMVLILISYLAALSEVANHLSSTFPISFPTFFFLLLITNILYRLLICLVWCLTIKKCKLCAYKDFAII